MKERVVSTFSKCPFKTAKFAHLHLYCQTIKGGNASQKSQDFMVYCKKNKVGMEQSARNSR